MFHVNHREFFECKLCGLDIVQDHSICLAHCKIKCHICVRVQVSAPKLRFKRNSVYVIKSDPKSSLTCQVEGWQELASALTAQGYTDLGWSGGPSDNEFVCAGYHWNPLAQPHVPSIPGTHTDGAPGPRVKSPWVQNATFDSWEFAVWDQVVGLLLFARPSGFSTLCRHGDFLFSTSVLLRVTPLSPPLPTQGHTASCLH